MSKTTFRETLVLTEDRRDDLTYKEKVVKNKIDRVITELSGSESGVLTKIATRYDRLEKAMKLMAEKRVELNEQLKEHVTDLFNAEDIVLTRVVETASFTMTLSKRVTAEEQDRKVVIDYKAIAEDLANLIPVELQAKIEEITKMYTVVSLAAEKSPALRVKSNKVEESLNEGVLDMIKGLAEKVLNWTKKVASWAVGYDKKLALLKAKVTKPLK